jgi:outer membrane protein OmpA-like peptidoglycan-associated protein
MIMRALRVAFAALLALGAVEAQGDPAGGWTLYLDFTFAGESRIIRDADRTKARQVAEYIDRNPTHRVGLDGMNQGRIASVRDALIGAGVSESRIQAGAFAEPGMRGERRVLVMVAR